VLTQFWSGIGGKLSERWLSVSTPALVFVPAVLLAWLHGPGSIRRVEEAAEWLERQSSIVQAVCVGASLVAVGGAALLVQRLTGPLLRFLEGYWPRWLGPIRGTMLRLRAKRIKRLEASFNELAPRIEAGSSSAEERDRFIAVDGALRRVPLPERRMPTRLGDTLRSAESFPYDKYGLDAVKCWPRLWLLLPEAVRQEVATARTSLDTATATILWGLLFVPFVVWAWWAVPVGLAVAGVAHGLFLTQRAETFADLVESTFDLHRLALYRPLRWPLPTQPEEEHRTGAELTEYLWRGSDDPSPLFLKE